MVKSRNMNPSMLYIPRLTLREEWVECCGPFSGEKSLFSDLLPTQIAVPMPPAESRDVESACPDGKGRVRRQN